MNFDLDWRGRLLLALTRLFGRLGLIEDKWADKK